MAHLKGPILIAAVVCCAFLWGYQQNSLRDMFARIRSVPKSEPVAEPVPQVAEAPQQVKPPAAAANTAYLSVPFPQQPAANAAPPPPPPVNPYAALGKASAGPRQNGNLAATMDSINSGEIQDEQVVRRNAYFEKLADQLKELRGEPPPPTAPSGSGDVAAENQPAFATPNFPGLPDTQNPEAPAPVEANEPPAPFIAEPPPLPPAPEQLSDEPVPPQDEPILDEEGE